MTDINNITVGVVALQGAFIEHCEILDKLNVKNKQIRTIEDFENVDALILPGGESTAMAKVSSLGGNSIFQEISKFVKSNKPVWGTCAGLILLADKVDGQKKGGQSLVGGLDIIASRNFFGAQVKSFEAPLEPPPLSGNDNYVTKKRELNNEEKVVEEEDGVGSNGTFNGVFIRAPAILSTGKNVEVLNTVDIVKEDDTHDKVIVAVKQNNLLATAFHPELTDDSRWHQYFVEDIVKKKS